MRALLCVTGESAPLNTQHTEDFGETAPQGSVSTPLTCWLSEAHALSLQSFSQDCDEPLRSTASMTA